MEGRGSLRVGAIFEPTGGGGEILGGGGTMGRREEGGGVTEWICRLEGGKGKLASFLFLFSVKKDGSDSQKIVALVVPSSSPCGPPPPLSRQGEASIFWAAQFLFFSFCVFLNEGGGGGRRKWRFFFFFASCFCVHDDDSSDSLSERSSVEARVTVINPGGSREGIRQSDLITPSAHSVTSYTQAVKLACFL